ncbi:MAG: FHA domain-containing protein, partial [Thermosynechococcaceae cyanobacterium]
TFHSRGVQLFHRSTTTFWDLPMLTTAIMIGKRSDTFRPDLDFRDLPQSEFLSRNHAQISVRNQQFYLEDLGSKNGTAINGVPLPKGQAQLLAFGDHLCLGGTEAFTFIFIKDQPVNTDHLSMISGQDRAFEAELLLSYRQSVTALLDLLKQAIASLDFAEVKRLANQIAIASYNVGADVMNLLAKQLEDQALQQVLPACQKTQAALHDGLVQVEQFAGVFYGT